MSDRVSIAQRWCPLRLLSWRWCASLYSVLKNRELATSRITGRVQTRRAPLPRTLAVPGATRLPSFRPSRPDHRSAGVLNVLCWHLQPSRDKIFSFSSW